MSYHIQDVLHLFSSIWYPVDGDVLLGRMVTLYEFIVTMQRDKYCKNLLVTGTYENKKGKESKILHSALEIIHAEV